MLVGNYPVLLFYFCMGNSFIHCLFPLPWSGEWILILIYQLGSLCLMQANQFTRVKKKKENK